jgi:hypothetical protein
MASEQAVRQYLAYWFQLGKGIVVNGGRDVLLPQPVIEGDRYSKAFEGCWRQAQSAQAGDCYLEGTSQTVAELLSGDWDVVLCARCTMPIPVPIAGVTEAECPCHDLAGWPNTELPLPRSPIKSQQALANIRQRLVQKGQSTG